MELWRRARLSSTVEQLLQTDIFMNSSQAEGCRGPFLCSEDTDILGIFMCPHQTADNVL